ncbi:Pimeloyl-ACP methyl ester carboxylesterase [Polaromonas sp. OV174]|uniref:alpha/beta fold hydrolase n=1 Tax=Polaromonas sp. OV174 TaxID=1855300 RepID=UPI0008E9DD73|nr:alpha/beta hydrolase [Polaromonas sp. OV174]SFC78181.1 Pimeloyl-ACP methyl ester carboxylesterase [Polaromonas sp. OV174]
MYKENRLFRSEFVPIRGLNYHVQIWQAPQTDAKAASAGPPQARPAPSGGSEPHAVGSVGVPLVLLHGWMDVAASYQFMVDALSDAFVRGRLIIAPDWRGFGQTSSGHAGGLTDSYWFPDYLADLDFLLDHYAPGQAVDLVGHSMGGNVAMLYAGVRPSRLRKLVNLEGFGMPASQPAQAPGRYAKWMDELKSLQRGELDLKAYDDVAGVARRLMKTNPRLTPDKANWLAGHWASPDAAGKWRILGDAAHKITSAQLYRADEMLEIYQRISAPTLAVEASDDSLSLWWKGQYTLAEYHERLKLVPQAQVAVIQDAGHMLHHDQPEQLAALIEGFLA